MPEPRALVAIERESGSVKETCWSGAASITFSIALRRFTSSSSLISFSLSRVVLATSSSDGVWRSAVSSSLRSRATLSSICARRRSIFPFVKLLSSELTALNLLPSIAKQPHLAAQGDKLRADLLNGGAVVFAEIGNGFVFRNEPSRQPHHFQIAASLTLQPPARLDSVEIAEDVKLEHRRRMISPPAGRCRGDAIEPQLAQFQRIDEHIDRPNRIAPVHPIIKSFR